MKHIFLIIFVLLLTSCVTAKYQNSIKINVPDTVAFNILEDYENYPNIIPIFHSAVKITSENRTGIGVRFNNVSVWGGYKMESTYKVVEYKLNEYIKLKNMTQYGLSELIVSKVGNNETEYTLINYTKIPFYMKKKLFKSFDNELEIIKQMCENGL